MEALIDCTSFNAELPLITEDMDVLSFERVRLCIAERNRFMSLSTNCNTVDRGVRGRLDQYESGRSVMPSTYLTSSGES